MPALRVGTAAIAITCASALSVNANAQSATEAPAAVDDGNTIVVSAQRRTENLQDVPVSVEVVSQAEMQELNITSFTTLAELNPSVRVRGSGRSSNFYIRGTGSGESQSFDQSVGTFIDDIYHGRSRLSEGAFLDLERIEVLKGPQTTFFGNNAIAGAFNVVTKKPGANAEGYVRGLISPKGGNNSGQYLLEGAATLPISEVLSFRAAGIVNGQRGYLFNETTEEYAGNKDNFALRGTLVYTPNDSFDATLKGEYGKSENRGGLVLRQDSCPPPAPFSPGGFCGLNLSLGGTPSIESNSFVGNAGNYIELETYETALTMNYYLADDTTLTSTTGFYGYDYYLDLDNDGTQLDLLNVHAPEEYEQFSQELRIASPQGGAIEYQAGIYYQHDKLDIVQDVSFFVLNSNIAGAAGTPQGAFLAPVVPYLPVAQSIRVAQTEDIYSAFASVTWNISEQLKLNGSLRGSIVEKDFDWLLFHGTANDRFGDITPFPTDAQDAINMWGRLGQSGQQSLSRSDKALMPSARLQYEVNPDVMLYASYNRGFKAGGFSAADTTNNPDSLPFDPEYVDAYEIGLKSELLDRTLRFNLAAFRNDFSDLQVVIQGTVDAQIVNVVRNAAKSRAQGIELEAAWDITPNFQLAATGMYLDSKYVSYPNAGATELQKLNGASTQDLSGKPTLYSPEWSGTLTGTLTLPVGDSYEITTQATGIFSSSYHLWSTIDPATMEDGYARLDLRLSLDDLDSGLGFDIIAKNVTNTNIINFAVDQPFSPGSLFRDREQYRNVAFQLRYNF